MPVTTVRPDWMLGGTYSGQIMLNGALVRHWNKQDHLYYEDNQGYPKRVFTPLDNRGNKNQDDYNQFFPGSFDESVFDEPDFCQNPKGNYTDADPGGCFL